MMIGSLVPVVPMIVVDPNPVVVAAFLAAVPNPAVAGAYHPAAVAGSRPA